MNDDMIKQMCERLRDRTTEMAVQTAMDIQRELHLTSGADVFARHLAVLVCDVVTETAELFMEVEKEGEAMSDNNLPRARRHRG